MTRPVTAPARVTARQTPDPGTITDSHLRNSGYWAAGRAEEAVALHEQVLAVRQRVLGPGHPDTVQSQNNLASAIVMAAGLAKPSTQPHRRSDKNNVPHGRRPTKSAGAHQRTPHADLEGLTEWSCH